MANAGKNRKEISQAIGISENRISCLAYYYKVNILSEKEIQGKATIKALKEKAEAGESRGAAAKSLGLSLTYVHYIVKKHNIKFRRARIAEYYSKIGRATNI